MPECKECGAHVSHAFAKVLGDENGNVYGCQECGRQASGGKVHSEDLDHTHTIPQS